MTDTGWIVGALILGIVIGALVIWLMNRKAAGPSHSVKALRQESEKFREEVNDHFVETAELINNLTDSYKKVFDHLSEGAERLVDEKVLRERMPEVSDQEIRLKRIGQTASRPESSESKPGERIKAGAETVPEADEQSDPAARPEPEARVETENPKMQETPEASKTSEARSDSSREGADDGEKSADKLAASTNPLNAESDSKESDSEKDSKDESSEESTETSPERSSETAPEKPPEQIRKPFST